MSAALLRRGLELLGAPEAPQAAPGQAKPSGAPVKRTRKAKATQAQKLRNSAKGKVPKSALAEFQKRECQSYLGVNLKFMTSARSTVAESVTQQQLGKKLAQLCKHSRAHAPWEEELTRTHPLFHRHPRVPCFQFPGIERLAWLYGRDFAGTRAGVLLLLCPWAFRQLFHLGHVALVRPGQTPIPPGSLL
uniref:Active regulator of SIRT1 n=1 Tax=Felis catus TaxID=9685 RepID=A0ABI7YP09_FELCA